MLDRYTHFSMYSVDFNRNVGYLCNVAIKVTAKRFKWKNMFFELTVRNVFQNCILNKMIDFGP